MLVVSTKPAAFPLGGGCYANVDLATGMLFPVSLDKVGARTLSFPLPDYAKAVLGNGYVQWAYLSKARWLTTRGLELRVRP